jgi:hypothetical protein
MIEARSDILISRLIDGEAGAEDWKEFQALASAAPELWRELAEAQRQHELLGAVVADVANRADAVELPDLSEDISFSEASPGLHLAQRLSAYLGWGLAAALAIALWAGVKPNANLSPPIQHGGGTSSTGGSAPPPAQFASLDPSVLLQGYLDRGKTEGTVLGELPDKVLVETRPAAEGGGYEVLFIRTILERTRVPELYEFSAQDEAGRPVLAKYTGGGRRPL